MGEKKEKKGACEGDPNVTLTWRGDEEGLKMSASLGSSCPMFIREKYFCNYLVAHFEEKPTRVKEVGREWGKERGLKKRGR